MSIRTWTISLLFSIALCALGAARAEQPIRVFITGSQSWEMSGSSGGSRSGYGGSFSGGARPQTAEIIKTFNRKCPDLVITRNEAQANYVVLLDHEGGKNVLKRDNKIAVFARNGDVIFSRSVRMVGSAVDDACSAIRGHASGSPSGAKPTVEAESKPVEPQEWEPFHEIKHPPAAATPKAVTTPTTTKEIRTGMSPAEVEAVLGQPEARVSLGSKLLYRYKDMTIEFRDGGVVDVR